eukprot:EG_transcript_7388
MIYGSFFLLALITIHGSVGWDMKCWDPSTIGFCTPRVLLYSTVGTFSKTYLEMLNIMTTTGAFHLGPKVDIAVFAHHSWSPVQNSVNVSHFILLDEEAFFDMHLARPNIPTPTLPSQSSANKLRIFQLLPEAKKYDVIVMLDADIVVQANVLRLIGPICRDTLYAVSHRVFPRPTRQWEARFYQARKFTGSEISFLREKGLPFMNGGQFLFRPSAHLESLFWKAYLSYKRHPRASLYEQGHLNTVFLLQCQVRFTLTHLTLLGLTAAEMASPPAAYALVHVCDFAAPAARKLEVMRQYLATAFRPTETVQRGVLQRVWRCLDTSRDCGITTDVTNTTKASAIVSQGSKRPSRKPGTKPASRPTAPNGEHRDSQKGTKVERPSIRFMDSVELVATYSRLVSNPNVTHACQVGFPDGRAAAVALLANPAAGLTVLGGPHPEGDAMRELRELFPGRVINVVGNLETSLRTYLSLVQKGRPPCSAILLSGDGPSDGLPRLLPAIRAIMVPPGHVLALSAVVSGSSLVRETGCQIVSVGGQSGRWCTGQFYLAG